MCLLIMGISCLGDPAHKAHPRGLGVHGFFFWMFGVSGGSCGLVVFWNFGTLRFHHDGEQLRRNQNTRSLYLQHPQKAPEAPKTPVQGVLPFRHKPPPGAWMV